MSVDASAGVGDRWLAGETVDGVAFGPGQQVALARGPRAGERATVLLLVAVQPAPTYRVRTAAGDELLVRQPALRAVDV